MLAHLRHDLKSFSAAGPGRRFRDRQLRHRGASPWQRGTAVIAGSVLFIAGIFMLVLPGPGIVSMLLGLALLSGESQRAAEFLDDADVLGHAAWRDGKRRMSVWPRPVRWLVVALVLGAGAAVTMTCTYLSWRLARG